MSDTSPPCQRTTAPIWLGAGLLALVVILVYLPAMCGGFVWDDDRLLTENPAVKTADGLYSIWFGNWAEDYIPLTLSSFWVEWHIWGNHPAGYHIVNVLLHAANVILLWRVLRRLRIAGCWLAALLFAVHPVGVASVAWIAERKNTLSMLFYLLSLLSYLRFDEDTQMPKKDGLPRHWYFLSLTAFLFALLAKSSTAILPGILLLVLWWRRGRIVKDDLDRCTPFFILAVLLGLVAVAVQSRAVQGGVGVIHDSPLVRLLGGARAIWFYFGKDLWPANQMMIYPRWAIDPSTLTAWLPVILFAGAFFLVWNFRGTWGRPFFIAFAYFVLALAPALGLINLAFFSNSRVADHFQYLAIPGVAALVAACLKTKLPKADWAVAWVLAAALAWTTVQREMVMTDSGRLWEDNFAKNPNSWKVCMNLSVVRLEEGRTDEAAQLKSRADELLNSISKKPR